MLCPLFLKSLESTALVPLCHSTDVATEAQKGQEFGHLSSDTLFLTETGCLAEGEKDGTLIVSGKVKVNYCFGTISWWLPLCSRPSRALGKRRKYRLVSVRWKITFQKGDRGPFKLMSHTPTPTTHTLTFSISPQIHLPPVPTLCPKPQGLGSGLPCPPAWVAPRQQKWKEVGVPGKSLWSHRSRGDTQTAFSPDSRKRLLALTCSGALSCCCSTYPL